ncbi:MAG: hypothetical protein Q7T33_12645 [Dehalococcoidia bacterium]|nr:hypothetical protein [Dehalococcoidia bacterium]
MRDHTAEDDRRYEKAQNAAFAGEHLLAYLCAIGAVALAVLGLLEGLGTIDLFEAGRGAQEGAPNVGDASGTNIWDGVLFLLPALTLAILSFYFHSADHHRLRDVRTVDDKDKAAWGIEHSGAMVTAAVAVVMSTIGVLVGFDAFSGGYTAEDGVLWQIGALIPATLSCTLHAVRHHQLSVEEDYIVALVESRVTSRSTGGTIAGAETQTQAGN